MWLTTIHSAATFVIATIRKQEAQLSQRDRARFVPLNILLSHSSSLKVIRNDTVE